MLNSQRSVSTSSKLSSGLYEPKQAAEIPACMIIDNVWICPKVTRALFAKLGITGMSYGLFEERFNRIGCRFRRHIQQDELGPTNAEINKHLKRLLRLVTKLHKELVRLDSYDGIALSNNLEVLIDESNVSAQSSKMIDELLFAIADLAFLKRSKRSQAIIDKISKTGRNAHECLSKLEFCEVYVEIGLAEIAAVSKSLARPSDEQSPFEVYCDRLVSFCEGINRVIKQRSAISGPKIANSLHLLVYDLANLYKEATGKPITHSERKQHQYKSAPQSEFGRFAMTAASQFAALLDLKASAPARATPVRAQIYRNVADLRRRLQFAVRFYVLQAGIEKSA